MLVLKTPAFGAQPLAAALDDRKIQGSCRHHRRGRYSFGHYARSRQARAAVQKRMEDLLPMNDPATGRRSRGNGLCRALSWPSSCFRHPKIQKPTFYLRESSAHVKCLTDIFPRLRGWGEAPCKNIFRGCRCE